MKVIIIVEIVNQISMLVAFSPELISLHLFLCQKTIFEHVIKSFTVLGHWVPLSQS